MRDLDHLERRLARLEQRWPAASDQQSSIEARRFLEQFSSAELRRLLRFAEQEWPERQLIPATIAYQIAKGKIDDD